MITSQVETFTPEKAAAALMLNTSNRPLSRNVVQAYAAAMKRGEWCMNGQPIIFFEDGGLADGQHRLSAIISAEKTVDVLVVRGTARPTFSTIDGGSKRRVGDVLAINGEKNTHTLASALKAFERIRSGSTTSRNHFTSTQADKILSENPSVRYWCEQYVSAHGARSLFSSALIGVLAIAAMKHGDEVVHEFLRQIDTGIGLTEKSPALKLRDKFMARKPGTHILPENSMALYIKAINAHISKKPMGVLRYGSEESFPEIV